MATGKTVIDQMMDNVDVQEHKLALRGRYAQEGLTRLELRRRHKHLAEDAYNDERDENGNSVVDPVERELVLLEMALVGEMIEESAPEQPSPVDVMQHIAETNPEGAEAIEHTLKMVVAREAVTTAQTDLDDSIAAGWGTAYQDQARNKLAVAQEALSTLESTPSPFFAREAEARAHDDVALEKRFAADSMPVVSADAEFPERDAMYAEADAADKAASDLRGFKPTLEQTV